MSDKETPGGKLQDLEDWIAKTAVMIDQLDAAEFPRHLVDSLRRIVPFELVAIFINRGRSRPICIFDDFPNARARMGIENYVKSSYVLNPFYRAQLAGLGEGVYRIRDLVTAGRGAAKRSQQSKIQLMDSEEIGYATDHWPLGLEEVDIAVRVDGQVDGQVDGRVDAPVDGRVLAEVSIYRKVRRGGFSDSDLAELRRLLPLISASFRRFWQSNRHHYDERPLDSSLDDHYDYHAFPELSARERAVAQLVLRGHSSESIGEILGISITTVKTHRKRSYAKLGISSQSELFWLFMKSARQPVT